MTIPSQNDFLLPFLRHLSDGNIHTRRELGDFLITYFALTAEDIKAKLGAQHALTSRVAWCDIHYVKAGFVTKRQHISDSLLDEFRITSLGVRELRYRANSLTVGYLQSFYKGKVYRGAGADDSTSDAEMELCAAFEILPSDFKVFHSVRWNAKEQGTVGEADFLIAHPQHGVLVLEVKGGLVSLQNGIWYTTNRFGRTESIQDPCKQAERNRRALSVWLEMHPRTRNQAYALFPAIALPDSRVDGDIRPECPTDIFLDIRHISDVKSRLLEIFTYWHKRADKRNQQMGGQTAVDALIELLVPTRQLDPRIADIFERERKKIDELTHQQFKILRQMRQWRRAAIVGGAGTGKTMLAMEKAQQLLNAGFRVLFLCFNKNLQRWISDHLRHENLMVATFHGTVGHAINWAHISVSRPQEFNEAAADLLMTATHKLQATQDPHLFDAIIVDEGQDFEDTWWIPLPDLLRDPAEGVLYVFFDDNQRIYQQISNIPMRGDPLLLNENCRNTQHIHAQLSAYAHAEEATDCLGPEGRPTEIIAARTPQDAKRELQRVLHRLVNEENIRLEDIVILTPAADKRSQWKQDERLGNFTLSWYLDTEMPLAIRVCTIYRYKGLESAVVILTELEQAHEEIRDQLVYVGLSRARHHAIVIGELPQPLIPA